jgi:uncharacterized protein (DUF885 family)
LSVAACVACAIALAIGAAVAGPPSGAALLSPAGLREMAHDFYLWYYEEYPVVATDAGRHNGDGRLADYSEPARERRRAKTVSMLAALDKAGAAGAAGWTVDDSVDLELFRSDLARLAFEDRVLRRARRDPGLYVEECANGIFSLLKKDYAPRSERARAAGSRLVAIPPLLEQARASLDEVVPLLAKLARQQVEGLPPLFNDSLGILLDEAPQRDRAGFVKARDEALAALRVFGAWLKSREGSFKAPLAMGRDNYDRLLREVYLLPFDSLQLITLGQIELARAKAMESWLADPNLADTLRSADARPGPTTSQQFLAAYESQTPVLLEHLSRHEILTVPNYIGPFRILELPEAFRPTSPGGFMNPPGVFDPDPSGFYFLPAFDPNSRNFYMRAALSNPLPILGHEGIPGHFLQISIANHNPVEIRRMHQDGVFQEGWALYGEEMLMRTGLYDQSPEGRAQVLRLMRYRAARIPVDVKLATGEWGFSQAVSFFMKEGGLDREAATGEAAGAAVTPGQKMNYIMGKYQIERLLGLYRDRRGGEFRLGEFHDRLLSYGSLPLSLVEWLMLGNDSTFRSVAVGGRTAEPAARISRVASGRRN